LNAFILDYYDLKQTILQLFAIPWNHSNNVANSQQFPDIA